MTHYLRSRHDGILIGVGTAVADDPSLDCRIAGLFKLYREGCGRPPWIVTALREPPADKRVPPEKYGGKYIIVEIATSDIGEHHLDWNILLVKLKENGLNSVMVEGGGQVINSLLSPQYRPNINMVIVTIAPTWLGQGGVVVSPKRCFNDAGIAIPTARLIIPFS
ncbi:Dihydrofolate reductase-like domain protein, partial [Metarhizium brunneum ARSEF 3297]